MDEETAYEVLGMAASATDAEIAAQFHALARKYHPDANARWANKFARIGQAYGELKTPAKRAAYDAKLKMDNPEPCGPCHGTGQRIKRKNWVVVEAAVCARCNGTGRVRRMP